MLNCGRPAQTRGQCHAHYSQHLAMVRRGETTWAELEAEGKAVAPRKVREPGWCFGRLAQRPREGTVNSSDRIDLIKQRHQRLAERNNGPAVRPAATEEVKPMNRLEQAQRVRTLVADLGKDCRYAEAQEAAAKAGLELSQAQFYFARAKLGWSGERPGRRGRRANGESKPKRRGRPPAGSRETAAPDDAAGSAGDGRPGMPAVIAAPVNQPVAQAGQAKDQGPGTTDQSARVRLIALEATVPGEQLGKLVEAFTQALAAARGQ